MTELPKMRMGMNIDQALYLELLNILVDEESLPKPRQSTAMKNGCRNIKGGSDERRRKPRTLQGAV